MRVVGAGVDLQLAKLLGAELRPRQHPLHGAADDLFGSPLEEVTEGLLLVALGMAAVADVELRLALVAGDGDPRRVEDDDVVARVEVRRVGRLVLALEDAGDPRRQAAERLVRGIDDEPASLDLALTNRVGLSRSSVLSRLHVSSPVRRPRATRRRQRPFAGAVAPSRAGVRAASASRTSCLIHLSATDLQEDGHDPADHAPEEGIRPDVDRHERAFPPDPDRVNGPDRVAGPPPRRH